MTNTGSDLARVEAKLDVLIRLMALSVAPESLTLENRAVRLQRAGLAPKDIASLIGTTSNAVRVALSGAKRRGKRKKVKNG
jgi:DNA-directed RNA polymerase specialized sigma24 family protein